TGVRHRKYRRFGNGRMACQRVVDLSRRNLIAASIDQLVQPTVKCQEPLIIETANVPRFKPTIDKQFSIKLRRANVARHYGWTAHKNFALLPGRKPATIFAYNDNSTRPWNAACASFKSTRRGKIGR